MICKFAFAALAAASLLTATGAHAEIRQALLTIPQVNPQRSVSYQLQDFISTAFESGYQRVVADERGAIVNNNRPVATFKVRLERGVLYRFGARCDEDCNDLDMAVRDASGRELIADRDLDNTPGFNFRPNWTGEYTVVLELVDCAAGRSQVGATVLARY
jgi:hypothetical protein